MSTRYIGRATDEVYVIPNPRAFGVFFSHSSDPSGDALVSAVLLRASLVYLMRPDPNRVGGYLLATSTQGSASGTAQLPSNVANNARGVPVGVFLSEFNAKWRKWATSKGIAVDTVSSGPASAGGPVWEVPNGSPSTPDVHIATLAAAAKAWGWQRLVIG